MAYPQDAGLSALMANYGNISQGMNPGQQPSFGGNPYFPGMPSMGQSPAYQAQQWGGFAPGQLNAMYGSGSTYGANNYGYGNRPTPSATPTAPKTLNLNDPTKTPDSTTTSLPPTSVMENQGGGGSREANTGASGAYGSTAGMDNARAIYGWANNTFGQDFADRLTGFMGLPRNTFNQVPMGGPISDGFQPPSTGIVLPTGQEPTTPVEPSQPEAPQPILSGDVGTGLYDNPYTALNDVSNVSGNFADTSGLPTLAAAYNSIPGITPTFQAPEAQAPVAATPTYSDASTVDNSPYAGGPITDTSGLPALAAAYNSISEMAPTFQAPQVENTIEPAAGITSLTPAFSGIPSTNVNAQADAAAQQAQAQAEAQGVAQMQSDAEARNAEAEQRNAEAMARVQAYAAQPVQAPMQTFAPAEVQAPAQAEAQAAENPHLAALMGGEGGYGGYNPHLSSLEGGGDRSGGAGDTGGGYTGGGSNDSGGGYNGGRQGGGGVARGGFAHNGQIYYPTQYANGGIIALLRNMYG